MRKNRWLKAIAVLMIVAMIAAWTMGCAETTAPSGCYVRMPETTVDTIVAPDGTLAIVTGHYPLMTVCPKQ